jgi:hypothetical protein
MMKLVCFILFSFVYTLKIQNLIKNPLFDQLKFKDWSTNSPHDNIQDFQQPSIWNSLEKSKYKTGLKFNFEKNEYKHEQALLQSIFPNKQNQLSNYKGLVMVSLSHILKDVDSNGFHLFFSFSFQEKYFCM